MCIVHNNSEEVCGGMIIYIIVFGQIHLQRAIVLEYYFTVVAFIPFEPSSSTSVHITVVDPQINYVTGQTTIVRAEKVNCLYSHYNGARACITL